MSTTPGRRSRPAENPFSLAFIALGWLLLGGFSVSVLLVVSGSHNIHDEATLLVLAAPFVMHVGNLVWLLLAIPGYRALARSGTQDQLTVSRLTMMAVGLANTIPYVLLLVTSFVP